MGGGRVQGFGVAGEANFRARRRDGDDTRRDGDQLDRPGHVAPDHGAGREVEPPRAEERRPSQREQRQARAQQADRHPSATASRQTFAGVRKSRAGSEPDNENTATARTSTGTESWLASSWLMLAGTTTGSPAPSAAGGADADAAALTELASWRTWGTALSPGATGGPLLARVRRVLSLPDDKPRPIAGLVIVACGMVLTAALVVHASSAAAGSDAALPAWAASEAPAPTVEPPRPGLQVAAAPATDRRIRNTDHFEIHYEPDLDLHAERVGREAEHAYERISGDLRHNLALRVPIVLFRTTPELAVSVQTSEPGHAPLSAVKVAAGDRILLAVDRPADQWLGLITHEVAHIFGFDILPGMTTPSWILEGLAEYRAQRVGSERPCGIARGRSHQRPPEDQRTIDR